MKTIYKWGIGIGVAAALYFGYQAMKKPATKEEEKPAEEKKPTTGIDKLGDEKTRVKNMWKEFKANPPKTKEAAEAILAKYGLTRAVAEKYAGADFSGFDSFKIVM